MRVTASRQLCSSTLFGRAKLLLNRLRLGVGASHDTLAAQQELRPPEEKTAQLCPPGGCEAHLCYAALIVFVACLPTLAVAADVSFEQDVMAVVSKAG